MDAWNDNIYTTAQTAINTLAKALGCTEPSACPHDAFSRPLDELLTLLGSQLDGMSANTCKTYRNRINRLFNRAEALGILAPVSAPAPLMSSREAQGAKLGHPYDTTPYRRERDDWPAEIRNWWEGAVDDLFLKLRDSTLEMYGQALAAYMGYLSDVQSPDELYDARNLKGFARWHAERRGTRGLTPTCRMACKALIAAAPSEAQKERVRDVLQSRPAPPVHNKTREADDISLAELDAVGAQLVNEGRRPACTSSGTDPARYGVLHALLFQQGLMLRLLVRVPLRSRNLREMELGQNLYRDQDGRWLIHFEGEELKIEQRNGQLNVFRVAFPEDLVPILDEFVEDYRPKLVPAPNEQHLFLTRSGNPFNQHSLPKALGTVVYKYTGKHFYPHLIRTLWPSEMVRSEADLRAVAYMMGDKPETIWAKYYAHSGNGLQAQAMATLRSVLGTPLANRS